MTSGGIDWQREKWQSGLGSKFIVQTVSLAAHALSDTLLAEHPLVLLVLILPTLIRVENQVCSGRDLCKRLIQHGGYHAEYRAIRYGITDQIATVQIENTPHWSFTQSMG